MHAGLASTPVSMPSEGPPRDGFAFPLGAPAPVVGIVGWKNSGKTTLVERLVATFTSCGFDVAAVKHAHHGLEIDQEGTDSGRQRNAGARQVIIVSRKRMATIVDADTPPEPSLAAVLSRLQPCDLVLVEGCKQEPIPKIEVRRSDANDTGAIAPGDDTIIAIASDHAVEDDTRQVFALDAIDGIADFILSTVMRTSAEGEAQSGQQPEPGQCPSSLEPPG